LPRPVTSTKSSARMRSIVATSLRLTAAWYSVSKSATAFRSCSSEEGEGAGESASIARAPRETHTKLIGPRLRAAWPGGNDQFADSGQSHFSGKRSCGSRGRSRPRRATWSCRLVKIWLLLQAASGAQTRLVNALAAVNVKESEHESSLELARRAEA